MPEETVLSSLGGCPDPLWRGRWGQRQTGRGRARWDGTCSLLHEDRMALWVVCVCVCGGGGGEMWMCGWRGGGEMHTLTIPLNLLVGVVLHPSVPGSK